MTAAADWTAWTCRVRVRVTHTAALTAARTITEDVLATVDRACSRFRPDSELSTVDAAAGKWTPVGPVLEELLAVALHAARATDGAVDPTVAVSLIGLGYDRDIADIPAHAPVFPTPAPGWHAVELDRTRHRVRTAPGVHLDLGATAKAWAVDRAADLAARATGSGCLVSIDGDIAVAGPAPEGGWPVWVEDVTAHPADAPTGASTVVRLHAGGLATSSTRARAWHRGGIDLHHLVDPRTGLPPAPVWRTVTAAADSCVRANTVTTAAIVRGHEAWRGLRWAALPVRLVTVTGEVLTLGGWPEAGTT